MKPSSVVSVVSVFQPLDALQMKTAARRLPCIAFAVRSRSADRADLDRLLALGAVLTSNSTFWFSFRVLKPLPWISEKWAKRSSPPPSGLMNPKPLESLNHFTVPVLIAFPSLEKPGLPPGRVQRHRKRKTGTEISYCFVTRITAKVIIRRVFRSERGVEEQDRAPKCRMQSLLEVPR